MSDRRRSLGPGERRRGRRPLQAAAAAALCATMLIGGAGLASARGARGSGSHSTAVPAGVTLRVADQLDFLEDVLADAGQNKGFPYKVQYSEFVGGPPMLQAFQAGAVDVGYVADTPIIFAQAAHQQIVAVAAWSTAKSGIALVSAPGVHLSGWASLKGKKVAYQQGTVEEAVLLEGLSSVGLDLHDITPVNLSTTSIQAALENGSVSAGVLVQPLTAAYLHANPTAAQVLLGSNITARADMLIASEAALGNKGKKAALANYITRVQRAYAWVDAHPDQYAKDLYVKQYKVPLAEGEKLVEQEGKVSFFSLPGPLRNAQQVLANLYYQAGEIPVKVDTAAEFSTAFNSLVSGGK